MKPTLDEKSIPSLLHEAAASVKHFRRLMKEPGNGVKQDGNHFMVGPEKLLKAADDARARVSGYSPEKKAELLAQAREQIGAPYELSTPPGPLPEGRLKFYSQMPQGTTVFCVPFPSGEPVEATGLEDLKVMQMVEFQGLCGPIRTLVEKVEGIKATAGTPKAIWQLTYQPDRYGLGRGGWACTCGISRAAFEWVTFDMGPALKDMPPETDERFVKRIE